MSLTSWKKEFYPTPAERFAGRKLTHANGLRAIDHSLRKWRGALKKNTKRHGVKFEDGYIGNTQIPEALKFRVSSCSLCRLSGNHYIVCSCRNCPIYKTTGGVCLEASREVIERNDPRPMIHLLERVRKLWEACKYE